MPLSDHARWRVALRTAGAVVAVVSAVVAIWLIARGNDSKTVQIGVIVGLWAALLGSATLFGTRRPTPAGDGLRRVDLDRVVEASARHAEQAARLAAAEAAEGAAASAARQAVEAVREAGAGREVERRRSAELEHERDEATRREYALSLELMLRREMERVLRDELTALRQEVAGLRNDLVEKVPGQIRLERIETTRLIGSDLEALQAEVRRLSDERVSLGGLTTATTTTAAVTASSTNGAAEATDPAGRGYGTGTPAVVRPARVVDPVHEPEPRPRPARAAESESEPEITRAAGPVREPVHEPELVRPAEPERARAAGPVHEPVHESVHEPVHEPLHEPVHEPVREPVREPDRTPTIRLAPVPPGAATRPVEPPMPPEPEYRPTFPAAGNGDPFADLPRLSRWVDPFGDAEPAPVTDTTSTTVEDDGGPRYVGRRRQAAEEREAREAAAAAAGHHQAVAESAAEPAPEPEPDVAPESAPAPEPAPAAGSEVHGGAGSGTPSPGGHVTAAPTGGHRRRREDLDEDADPVHAVDAGEPLPGGRRRRADDPRGGHSRPDPDADDPRGGHSRPDPDADDLLSRLLGR